MCAAGAGGAAAVAHAIRASGVLVQLEPVEFQRILDRVEEPLVVTSERGIFSTTYQYMTSYKGLAFHTRTSEPIHLPRHAVTVTAKRMWIP